MLTRGKLTMLLASLPKRSVLRVICKPEDKKQRTRVKTQRKTDRCRWCTFRAPVIENHHMPHNNLLTSAKSKSRTDKGRGDTIPHLRVHTTWGNTNYDYGPSVAAEAKHGVRGVKKSR